MTSAIESVG